VEADFGSIWNEILMYYFSGLKTFATSPKQFFLLTIGQDIEAQKNLDQKNHSSMEINSPKVGGSSKKWCKTLPKYTTSIGFLLKSEKLMNFTNFLIFNRNPMEVEHFGRVLLHFLLLPPTLGELISKLE
tara:strand:- start:168 stop:554 length:387 start_codon:yes stop_codon:yes gene_type:complete